MKNTDSDFNEKCLKCRHYGFCQVYWGIKCKRQGGNKIPKMRRITQNSPVTEMIQVNKNWRVKIKPDEPIQTRLPSWG
jgi:hypothetical protein